MVDVEDPSSSVPPFPRMFRKSSRFALGRSSEAVLFSGVLCLSSEISTIAAAAAEAANVNANCFKISTVANLDLEEGGSKESTAVAAAAAATITMPASTELMPRAASIGGDPGAHETKQRLPGTTTAAEFETAETSSTNLLDGDEKRQEDDCRGGKGGGAGGRRARGVQQLLLAKESLGSASFKTVAGAIFRSTQSHGHSRSQSKGSSRGGPMALSRAGSVVADTATVSAFAPAFAVQRTTSSSGGGLNSSTSRRKHLRKVCLRLFAARTRCVCAHSVSFYLL